LRLTSPKLYIQLAQISTQHFCCCYYPQLITNHSKSHSNKLFCLKSFCFLILESSSSCNELLSLVLLRVSRLQHSLALNKAQFIFCFDWSLPVKDDLSLTIENFSIVLYFLIFENSLSSRATAYICQLLKIDLHSSISRQNLMKWFILLKGQMMTEYPI